MSATQQSVRERMLRSDTMISDAGDRRSYMTLGLAQHRRRRRMCESNEEDRDVTKRKCMTDLFISTGSSPSSALGCRTNLANRTYCETARGLRVGRVSCLVHHACSQHREGPQSADRVPTSPCPSGPVAVVERCWHRWSTPNDAGFHRLVRLACTSVLQPHATSVVILGRARRRRHDPTAE